jgi:hypothetical protein
MSSYPILYLNTWDGYTPVMLPYGAKTMDGIVAASNGVLLPFLIFVLFLFRFLYHNQWVQEYNRLAAAQSTPTSAGHSEVTFAPRTNDKLQFRYAQEQQMQPLYMQQPASSHTIPVWTIGGN